MITKFHRLIVPPPYTKQEVLEIAEIDWQKDLALASTLNKDDGVPNPSALDYEVFWRAMFQLVDTW